MKLALFLAVLLALPNSLDAAEVTSARLNFSTNSIDVDVRYVGGCKDHRFGLQVQGCLETSPVRCEAKLIDRTRDDFCEAILWKTASFSLAEYGLTDSYYRGATITITGDFSTKAFVVLPR
jgi:hypothetical protein